MSRIFDAILFAGELDILECRVRELYDVVDRFVVVEVGETHLRPGRPVPSAYLANTDRFAAWQDKILHYLVPGLASTRPIDREHEHREELRQALRHEKVDGDDIVMQSDADEIPSAKAVRLAVEMLGPRARGLTPNHSLIAFEQTLHCFAVDWQHPVPSENKPAMALYRDIRTFTEMRLASRSAVRVRDGGWHFTWMGTSADHLKKIDSIYEGDDIQHVRGKLASGELYRTGTHVDGRKLTPIEVTDSFPEYVRSRRCPPCWFRPR